MMLLEVTLTSWADRGYLALISVATVFVILIILVFVLQVFSWVAQSGAKKAPKAAAPAPVAKAAPVADASEEEKAAVAVALYLYMNNAHDEESGVLTIAPNQTAWGAVLNPRL